MKKFLKGTLVFSSAFLVLAGAHAFAEESSNDESVEMSSEMMDKEMAELKDGEYHVVSNLDDHGWKLDHKIVVKDGKIVESMFDYVNEEGAKKSEDAEYNKMMKEKSGISAAEAMEELNKALVEKQTADVDVVTGATSTTDNFMRSAKALIALAEEGRTETVNIDEETVGQKPLQDGKYTLEAPEDNHGYTTEFVIEVKDGKVVDAVYTNKDADGKDKKEDEEYNKTMKEKSGVAFKEAVEQLETALKEGKDLEVVSGATHTSETFIEEAKLLLEAAQEGNMETIIKK